MRVDLWNASPHGSKGKPSSSSSLGSKYTSESSSAAKSRNGSARASGRNVASGGGRWFMNAENPPEISAAFFFELAFEPDDLCDDAKDEAADAPSSRTSLASSPSLPLSSLSSTLRGLAPETRNTLPALVATNRFPKSPTLAVFPKLSPVTHRLVCPNVSKFKSTRKGWNSA